jgi:diadenosine tetraphosphate (Ap4A) HIT family hydrolase
LSVQGCLACDATAGRIDVPGGMIAETEHWHADHCIGPFGVGAVVVKTKEHVEDLWHLPDGAAGELGPFLCRISGAIVDGLGAERAYLTMWVDKPPLHAHMVLYPRWPGDPTGRSTCKLAGGRRDRRLQRRQPKPLSVCETTSAILDTSVLRSARWIRFT